MEILVAGSGGQLAYDLLPRLAEAGFGVAGLDSKSLDITDREKVFKAVKEARPEVIINPAAYTKVDLAEKEKERAYAVNRDGAANLADASKEVGAALIHISTDFVFDGRNPVPYKETDAPNPLSVYGASKLAGEEEIIRRLGEHIIIRTSWLYGVHGVNFVKTILKYAGEREALRVVYDQTGTPTWTADLAEAITGIVRSCKRGEGKYGVYNYSNEGVASWYDFAETIIEEARHSGMDLKCRKVEPILTHEYPTPAKRPAYSVLDKERIKKTFGISIPHWRRSLRSMIEEFRDLKA